MIGVTTSLAEAATGYMGLFFKTHFWAHGLFPTAGGHVLSSETTGEKTFFCLLSRYMISRSWRIKLI